MKIIPNPASNFNHESQFEQLQHHLLRGASFGYYYFIHPTKTYWCKKSKEPKPIKRSMWFPADRVPKVPSKFRQWNCYFGVHGSDRSGTEYQRTAVRHGSESPRVTAVNGFYAEFDAKNFGTRSAMDHILSLPLRPSYLIESSNGSYHGYWLIDSTIHLDTPEATKRAQSLQKRFVGAMGGDLGAADLQRVLRIEHTKNWKPAYAPDFPAVTAISARIGTIYTLDQIESLLPTEPEPEPKRIYDAPADASDVEQALAVLGAQHNLGYENKFKVLAALNNDFGADRAKSLAEKYLSSIWTNRESMASKVDGMGSGGAVGIGTIFHIAKNYGYLPREVDGYTPSPEYQTREQFTEYLQCARLDVRQEYFGDHVPTEYHAKYRDDAGEIYKTVYRTTNTDKRIASAILDLCEKRGTRKIAISSVELARMAGVGSDSTARKSLARLSGWFVEKISTEREGFGKSYLWRLIWSPISTSLTVGDGVSTSLTSKSKDNVTTLSDVETSADLLSLYRRWDAFITGKSKAGRRLGNEVTPLNTTALLIIDSLTDCDGQTRRELSESTGTSYGSVSAAVRRMRDDFGMVCESEDRAVCLEPDWFEVLCTFAPKMASHSIVLERDERMLKRQIVNAAKHWGDDAGARRRLARLRNELRLTLLQLYPDLDTDAINMMTYPEHTAQDSNRVMAEAKRQRIHDEMLLERMENRTMYHRDLRFDIAHATEPTPSATQPVTQPSPKQAVSEFVASSTKPND